jgi:hypothetical protein
LSFQLRKVPSLSRVGADRADHLRTDVDAAVAGWPDALLLRVDDRNQVLFAGDRVVLGSAAAFADKAQAAGEQGDWGLAARYMVRTHARPACMRACRVGEEGHTQAQGRAARTLRARTRAAPRLGGPLTRRGCARSFCSTSLSV